jgi:hypothetical protein
MTRQELKKQYEEWEASELAEEARIGLAESGADREGDFDLERALENAYEHYLLLDEQ